MAGSHPHDVAPAPDGGVWYTGQRDGTLGYLDPATGDVRDDPARCRVRAPRRHHRAGRQRLDHRRRPQRDRPGRRRHRRGHGLPAPCRPARCEPQHRRVRWRRHPLVHRPGRHLRPARSRDRRDGGLRRPGGSRPVRHHGDARRGTIWYASLAGSHIAKVDRATGKATIVEPPTPNQGARRVWSDSRGRIWVSEWDAGQVGMHDPATGEWREWPLPGDGPQTYAVYVDDRDIVWLTDFGANAIVRFDPSTERFDPVELPSDGSRRSSAPRPPRRGLGRRVRPRQAGPRHRGLSTRGRVWPRITRSSGRSPRCDRRGRGRSRSGCPTAGPSGR